MAKYQPSHSFFTYPPSKGGLCYACGGVVALPYVDLFEVGLAQLLLDLVNQFSLVAFSGLCMLE